MVKFDEKSPDAAEHMKRVQTYLNSICKSSKKEKKVEDNRREYLSFLWLCYQVLPLDMVGTDPTKCLFDDPKEFGHNDLIKRLSDCVTDFLFDQKQFLSSVVNGHRRQVIFPDSDSKICRKPISTA